MGRVLSLQGRGCIVHPWGRAALPGSRGVSQRHRHRVLHEVMTIIRISERTKFASSAEPSMWTRLQHY
jgi:hypothetical protein